MGGSECTKHIHLTHPETTGIPPETNTYSNNIPYPLVLNKPMRHTQSLVEFITPFICLTISLI